MCIRCRFVESVLAWAASQHLNPCRRPRDDWVGPGDGWTAAGAAAAAGGEQLDPSQYLNAMQGVMQNPAFMGMAEKLGTQLMQDPQMANMLQVGSPYSYWHRCRTRPTLAHALAACGSLPQGDPE